MHRSIQSMQGDLRGLMEAIQNRPRGEVGDVADPVYDLLPELPLKTVADFEQFNLDLGNNAAMAQQFVRTSYFLQQIFFSFFYLIYTYICFQKSYLLSLGGESKERMIRGALSHSISNDIGMAYNWVGVRGHKKIMNYKFIEFFTSTYYKN